MNSRNLNPRIIAAFLLGAMAWLSMGSYGQGGQGRYTAVDTAQGIAVIDTNTGEVRLIDNANAIGVPFMRIISVRQK